MLFGSYHGPDRLQQRLHQVPLAERSPCLRLFVKTNNSSSASARSAPHELLAYLTARKKTHTIHAISNHQHHRAEQQDPCLLLGMRQEAAAAAAAAADLAAAALAIVIDQQCMCSATHELELLGGARRFARTVVKEVQCASEGDYHQRYHQ
jgi:hypothetical protein